MLQGRKNPTSMRLIIALQAKHNIKKGCMLFVVQVSNDEKVDNYIEDEEGELLKR